MALGAILRSRDWRTNLSRVSHPGAKFPRWRLRRHVEPLTAGRWVRLLEAACWGSDTTFACHRAGGSKVASTGHAGVGQEGRPVRLQLADWAPGGAAAFSPRPRVAVTVCWVPDGCRLRGGDCPGVRCALQIHSSKPEARWRRPFGWPRGQKAPRCRAPPIPSLPSFMTPSQAELPVGSLNHPASLEGKLRPRRGGWVPCPRLRGRSGRGLFHPGSAWHVTGTDRCGFELSLFMNQPRVSSLRGQRRRRPARHPVMF